MAITVGQVVDITVTFDGNYAVWGQTDDGQVGVVHCLEWSGQRPIPDESTPKLGDRLQVKVMRVVNLPQEELPADATFGGRIRIDFVGSVRHIGDSVEWSQWNGAP